MNVLILGSGGREHALAWRISKSTICDQVFVLPGNPGMKMFDSPITLVSGNPEDSADVISKASRLDIDLIIIGPEKPLDLGVADDLRREGFNVLGPSQKAAQLESSKIFSKSFMQKHAIPTSYFESFDNKEAALAALEKWDIDSGIVIKMDGLAAGKGVVVTHDRNEAQETVNEFFKYSKKILFEKKVSGKEVSVFALCDGTKAITLGYICDHKRIFDNDKGPNTGGMGTVSPRDWPSAMQKAFIEKEIMQQVVSAMKSEGTPFSGILFAGLMVGSDTTDNINVLEFNTRFGDPETQVLLPLLDQDPLPYFMAAAEGNLSSIPSNEHLKLKENTYGVHVVMSSGGYPSFDNNNLLLNQDINIPNNTDANNCFIFFAGVKEKSCGQLINSGGRVLGVTALGESIDNARAKAYQLIDRIHFEGAHWRKDIGKGF